MDIASIVGLIVGGGLVLAAIGSNTSQFIDIPSTLIVIGGGSAATLITMPLGRFVTAPKIFMKAFFNQKASIKDLVEEIVKYGEIARRDGILALEGVMEDVSNPFLSRGLQLAVDGSDPDTISETLTMEIDALASRHSNGKKLLDNLGKYAPAYGMIGTLVGLILMLMQLDDPASIAPNMAVALLTTLYGALMANLFALPLADKLEDSSADEVRFMSVVMDGIISIQ